MSKEIKNLLDLLQLSRPKYLNKNVIGFIAKIKNTKELGEVFSNNFLSAGNYVAFTFKDAKLSKKINKARKDIAERSMEVIYPELPNQFNLKTNGEFTILPISKSEFDALDKLEKGISVKNNLDHFNDYTKQTVISCDIARKINIEPSIVPIIYGLANEKLFNDENDDDMSL